MTYSHMNINVVIVHDSVQRVILESYHLKFSQNISHSVFKDLNVLMAIFCVRDVPNRQ